MIDKTITKEDDRKRFKKRRVTTLTRLRKDLYDELRSVSKERHITMSKVLDDMVEVYIAKLEHEKEK